VALSADGSANYRGKSLGFLCDYQKPNAGSEAMK
jgi:hypothetical protein